MSTASLPAPRQRQRFRRALLGWYRRHGRDLPWRHTSDPYHILVSEVMLQQTQVDRVLPKYHEWLGKYPSLAALAAAPPDEVAETWRPLGYNIRPRRLHAIACESVGRYGGQLPSGSGNTPLLQGHRRVLGRRDPKLRVSRACSHPRYERRPGALPRLRPPRRSEVACDAEASMGGVGNRGASQACLRFQSGADGSRCDGLRRTKAKVQRVPDDEAVQVVSME